MICCLCSLICDNPIKRVCKWLALFQLDRIMGYLWQAQHLEYTFFQNVFEIVIKAEISDKGYAQSA